MDPANDNSSSAGGGVDRQKKGRWKRAQQVCTNCRQMKLRCDFQERFPEPCTRCASSGLARGMPCHVDPSFRRITKRTSEAPSPPGHDEPGSSKANGPEAFAERLPATELLVPPSLRPATPPDPPPVESELSVSVDGRSLGTVHLSGEEVVEIFLEFFTYYHPFFEIILEPVSPDETFARSHYLFWAICHVGCRPRLDHPIERARTPDLCVELGKQVKSLFTQILLDSTRTHYVIQALILTCEFPFVMPEGREDFIWLYSGLAITIGTQMGLHRPKFAAEYHVLEDTGRVMARTEFRERILVWIQCFNVHQSLASFRGYPGLMADDWVLVKGATRPIEQLCNTVFHCPDVFRSLRIYRLIRRFSTAVGNDPSTASGQVGAETRRPLLAVFAAELSDLEAALKPTGKESKKNERIAHAIAVRLLEAKLQLYTFELQDDAAGATPEDLLICYTSAVRIVALMAELHKNPNTRAMFWPRSIYGSFVAAGLCLLKLAGIQVMSPRRLQIDRAVILKEIAVAYDIMKDRSICPGDISDRRARAIKFLASRLQNGALPFVQNTAGVSVRSRMSLGGLLYDAIIQLKAMRTAELRAAAHKEQEGDEQAASAPAANGRLTATEALAAMPPGVPAPAPDCAYTSPNTLPQPMMDMNGFQVPSGWEAHAAALDMSTVPAIESPEWLQMLSVENCAEIMSVPGFDAAALMPWDMDVPMMDPFALFTSGS